jgi:hypothetical protein
MLKSLLKKSGRFLDEPHEKLITISVLVLFFSAVYHNMHLQNPVAHFQSDRYETLGYNHFLWYSLMINFTMPLGDIYPLSDAAKVVTGIQGALFWIVVLSF